ncbi:hypothetical protein LCGC14_1585780 [marine sediment metagenome]|uniref:Uncharacterized protein n=1 Tax=marine sediment metagenome TaxID=412755 RepID=A0A0F9LFU2_9ZZZZ
MKRLKLPKRNSKVYKLIYDRGHFAGYNHGVSATRATADKVVVQDDVEVERQKVQLLSMAGQSVQSLANLGEAYSRLIMYASNQRFPKKNERNGW